MSGTYLDYAATTPMAPEVIAKITETMQMNYGNASSLYTIGRESRKIIEDTRQLVAKTLNANPNDIVFNSGGTEANNSALINAAKQYSHQGNHIITTAVEHSSVYQTMKYLESKGFQVTYLDFDTTGHISLDALKNAITDQTIIVSIMAGNNEVGSLQNLQAIGDLLAEKEIFFHTDTVQVYMHEPIDVQQLHVDALSMSAHKIYGPKGIGFMYYRDTAKNFHSYILGGDQENKHRAGTENVPLIAGMQKAIQLRLENGEQEQKHFIELRQYLLESAKERQLDFEVNGPQTPELKHILSIYWPNHPSDINLIKFDMNDIYLSAGSACTAGSLEPSRILVDMFGSDSPRTTESFRISFGEKTSFKEIDHFLDVCEQIK